MYHRLLALYLLAVFHPILSQSEPAFPAIRLDRLAEVKTDYQTDEGSSRMDIGDLSEASDTPYSVTKSNVEKLSIFELILCATNTYKSPYQQVSVEATFAGPKGSKTISGFWDGGNVWKIRFSPDAIGRWSYSTSSSDPGLVTSGNFKGVSSNLKGGIKPMPQNRYHFQYEDGTPVWWFGETNWAAFRSDASENLDSETFREYVDVRVRQGFNYLHGHLLAGPNEGGEPFLGKTGEVVNPSFWQEVDRRVQYMNSKGMIVGLMLAWKKDEAGTGLDWTDFANHEARKRYCRYVAARYSAYNVVWILSGEYDEAPFSNPNSEREWAELGKAVHDNDPHNRMMAIHGSRRAENFANKEWMSFGDYMQFYHDLHSAILEARNHAKPIINAEYAYFLRDLDEDGEVDKPNSATIEEFRHASWDIVMAGGYFVTGFGTTYGGGTRDPGPFDAFATKNDPAEKQLPLIKIFFTSVDWWKFMPADDLISGDGTEYCLSDHTGKYIAYIRGTTNPVQLRLLEKTGNQYSVRRFDPRTGSWTILPPQTSNTALVLTAPNHEDWVFLVERAGSAFNLNSPYFDKSPGSGNNHDVTTSSKSGSAAVETTLSFTDIKLSAGTAGPDTYGGHSATFCDVDNDGLPDLYITMLMDGPMSDLFFHNKGDNKFVNEAASRGIADYDGGSHGACFADLDNDGDYDFINGTTFGANGTLAINNIFRNDGKGYFTDITSQAGIPKRGWLTRAVVAFDMEKDGDLDLFCVTNYLGSEDPLDERNEVYRNDGNMRFFAINSGNLYTAPAGQGAVDTDYDGDGDIDIIAGNRTGDLNILNNDGTGNFTRIPPASIGVLHQGREGVSMGDIDNDGDLDMLLADRQEGPGKHLYLNHGDGTFAFSRTFMDMAGYMGGFADLDNDGDLDLVGAGDDVCYLNDGNGNFKKGPSVPVDGIYDPRAIAFADIDNDGDLDFAIGCKRSWNWLVRNNLNSGNWLKVMLISPQGQAGAFGAKTRIYPAGQTGGNLLGMRESRSNHGYLGQDDPVLHFGLGSNTFVDVVVTFLYGETVTFKKVAANQTIVIGARLTERAKKPGR